MGVPRRHTLPHVHPAHPYPQRQRGLCHLPHGALRAGGGESATTHPAQPRTPLRGRAGGLGPAFVNASRTSWPASCRSHTMTPRGWRNTPSASPPNCSPVRGLAAPPPPTSRPWRSAPWPCCAPAWSASSRWPCGPWTNSACAPSTTTNRCAPKGTCLSPSSPTSRC